ncbi:MAG: AP endonuclease [Epulopiscium sp. Nuni2H_MBin003]|nr:MAG: AP endonuclease [Epulopiscium sp. Nuni2H_MBin003]
MALQKCACLDMLYTELPWKERFQAAKDDGFDAVEFWDWRGKDFEETRQAAEAAGVVISGFNGDAEEFSLVDPTHKKGYLEYLSKSLDAAEKLNSNSVTIHSNALGDGGVVVNHYDELSHTVKLCAMYGTLLECAKMAEERGVNLNLEGLNLATDHAGNFLATTQMAAEVCRLINSPRLKILYDVYHMQINEGNLCDNISQYCDQIGHVHVADNPGRHEPGTGEINYKKIIRHLEECGYKGLIGYELFPVKDTKTAVEAIMKEC